jgi:hypothetical protein
MFTFATAIYNLVRMRNLAAAPDEVVRDASPAWLEARSSTRS